MSLFTLVRVFAFHVVLSGLLVVFVGFHVFVLHLWLSSCVCGDRCVSYVERVLFCSFVFLRDCVCGFCYVCFVVVFSLVLWSCVFHEESFVVFSVSVTASKVLPEWFFLWLFGVLKCVPCKLVGVFVLVCVFGVIVFVSCVLGLFGVFFRCSCVVLVCFVLFVLCVFFVGLCGCWVSLVFPVLLCLQCLVCVFMLIMTV